MTDVAIEQKNEQNIAAPDCEIDSDAHKEIRSGLMQSVQRGHLWPNSLFRWMTFLAPFGTENSFWNRLKMSVTFQHWLAYDQDFLAALQSLEKTSLKARYPCAQIAVCDVDTAVNNAALISALMLGVPMGILGSMSGNQDGWLDLVLIKLLMAHDALCRILSSASTIYSDVTKHFILRQRFASIRLFSRSLLQLFTTCAGRLNRLISAL
jgi:hypothetical protein